MLKEKLGTAKCFKTAWGKLITEEEAYTQVNRQIAAVCANLFQVMRIFEPSWEKRTEASRGRHTGGAEGVRGYVPLRGLQHSGAL